MGRTPSARQKRSIPDWLLWPLYVVLPIIGAPLGFYALNHGWTKWALLQLVALIVGLAGLAFELVRR